MLFAFFQIASNTNENFNNFTIKIIFVTLELLPSHSLQRDGATKNMVPIEKMTFQHLKVMLNNKSENISWGLAQIDGWTDGQKVYFVTKHNS